MDQPNQGTDIFSPIISVNGATHYSTGGAGGFMEVPSLARRDALPVGNPPRLHYDGVGAGQRRLGMEVKVTAGAPATWKTYVLEIADYETLTDAQKLLALADNANWQQKAAPTGGEGEPAGPTLVQNITANELNALRKAGLMSGTYRVTDYRAVQYTKDQYGTDLADAVRVMGVDLSRSSATFAADFAARPVEALIVTAVSGFILSPYAYSETFPTDRIEVDISYEQPGSQDYPIYIYNEDGSTAFQMLTATSFRVLYPTDENSGNSDGFATLAGLASLAGVFIFFYDLNTNAEYRYPVTSFNAATGEVIATGNPAGEPNVDGSYSDIGILGEGMPLPCPLYITEREDSVRRLGANLDWRNFRFKRGRLAYRDSVAGAVDAYVLNVDSATDLRQDVFEDPFFALQNLVYEPASVLLVPMFGQPFNSSDFTVRLTAAEPNVLYSLDAPVWLESVQGGGLVKGRAGRGSTFIHAFGIEGTVEVFDTICVSYFYGFKGRFLQSSFLGPNAFVLDVAGVSRCFIHGYVRLSSPVAVDGFSTASTSYIDNVVVKDFGTGSLGGRFKGELVGCVVNVSLDQFPRDDNYVVDLTPYAVPAINALPYIMRNQPFGPARLVSVNTRAQVQLFFTDPNQNYSVGGLDIRAVGNGAPLLAYVDKCEVSKHPQALADYVLTATPRAQVQQDGLFLLPVASLTLSRPEQKAVFRRELITNGFGSFYVNALVDEPLSYL